jgi:hypothetical protein
MKFEIHFEFRASLRKFQDLNFWDATTTNVMQLPTPLVVVYVRCRARVAVHALAMQRARGHAGRALRIEERGEGGSYIYMITQNGVLYGKLHCLYSGV